jgi:hypothetical protein
MVNKLLNMKLKIEKIANPTKIRDERGYWEKENTLLVAPENWLVS